MANLTHPARDDWINFVNCELVHPNQKLFFNLVNYFFSAIGDNIPKSLSLRSDDCNTVSTRSLDPGQHDDDPEVRRSTRPNKERRWDGGPRHRSGRR